jgi:hypothetical protein
MKFFTEFALAFAYVIPIGMIQAITNQQVGLKYVFYFNLFRIKKLTVLLSVITELIIGYMLPGKPIAMMMFKTWGYIVRLDFQSCLL